MTRDARTYGLEFRSESIDNWDRKIPMATKRHSVASTGGQWNFSGVLYQLLASLRSGLNATVEEVAISRDVASVRIVAEPFTGGDTQIFRPGVRQVDQIKIRRGKFPWTTRAIVEDVLPDLFKAFGEQDTRSQFRFVTDNLDGTVEFDGFLKTLRSLNSEGKGLADLVTCEPRFRWGNKTISAEYLFTKIEQTLIAPRAALWQFLAAVRVVVLSEVQILVEINDVLSELVTEREDIDTKRDALCTHLLSMGKTGGSISTKALLRAVNLDPARLTHARQLPAVLRQQVETEIQNEGYDRTTDVRVAPVVPEALLSVFSGESGRGKTWLLCRAALTAVEAGECAMLLPAKGALADIEEKIVRHIWLTSFDRSLPLFRIAERLQPKLPDKHGAWLTIFLDDLTDPDLAFELARTPWAHMGIRVVISAQDRIASFLRTKIEDLSEVAVPDFTLPELHDYLIRADRDTNLVPDDVLFFLTRPVLAAIYCRIPGSARWMAVSEYELMDRYWKWATTQHRTQDLHRRDGYEVLGLAGTLLDGPPLYPWPVSVQRRRGLTAEAIERLIAVGVLRQDAQGALQISHDRVLNWVVAGEIERRFLEGELTAAGIADLLLRIDDIAAPHGGAVGRRLGYVLLDLFWKLARSAKPEDVGQLALLIIKSREAPSEQEHFFKELGNLGSPIIPTLSWMARRAYPPSDWPLPRLLAEAFVVVAEAAETDVAEAACALIRDDVEPSRSIGLNVLRLARAPHALDLLWEINKQRNAALVASKDHAERGFELVTAHEQSFNALSRAVQQSPEWIREKASSTVDAEDANQLIWLLMRIDRYVAKPIWAATKSNLLARLSRGERSAPRAVRYFRDRDELQRIDAALENPEPYAAVLWFDALAYLAPERALQSLDRMPSRDLRSTRGWWLHGLFRRVGPAVHVRLRETIGREQGEREFSVRELAMLYSGENDLLDSSTFDYLIDAFQACMEKEANGDAVLPGVHGHLRALIGSITSPTLLDRLAARKGTRFEQLVARNAISRDGRTSMFRDDDGMEYRLILAAIGGDGYDQLVLAELDRLDPHSRADGFTAAVWTRCQAVAEKLKELARSVDSDVYRRVQLMDALAAHRVDAGLRAMVEKGSPVFLRAVAIRERAPPWADRELAQVARLLNSADSRERLAGIGLCAFLGRDAAGGLLAPFLEANDSTDEEVRHARGVLSHLGYYRPTFLSRLKTHMGRDDTGVSTASYFAWNGDADARAVVIDWLRSHDLASLNSEESRIALRLLYYPDTAADAQAFLKRIWTKWPSLGEGNLLAPLAEAGDNEARAALHAMAYQEPSRGVDSAVAAILALRKSSPAAAQAATERLYRRTRSRAAACLLLEFNAEVGAKILLDDYAAASVPDRHQIGRLLRCRAPRAELVETLNIMSDSSADEERQTAAEIAGWLPFEQPVDWLDRLVDDDAEIVEKAALMALRQRQADAECATLLGSLASQPRPRQWAWLRALVQRGDPAALTDRNDPRSISSQLDQLGDEFKEEARILLREREKALQTTANNLETERRRCARANW